ncbi:MAG: hypothetical protein ACREOI_05620 [bacterium]
MNGLEKYIEKRKKRSPKFVRNYESGYENFRIGWKDQLLKDVQSIRFEVRRKGGIKAKTIDAAVRRYRKTIGASGA